MQLNYENNIKLRQWRPIQNAPGYYIRSDGKIESRATGKLKRLKGWRTKDGYRQFLIRGRKLYAHQIVLRAFVGLPPSDDHVCDHLDFNKQNNDVSNLRWLPRGINTLRRPETAHRYP